MKNYIKSLPELLMPSLIKLFCFRKINSMSLAVLKNNKIIEPEFLYIVGLMPQRKAVIDIGNNMHNEIYIL
jgi:hypothetical protein